MPLWSSKTACGNAARMFLKREIDARDLVTLLAALLVLFPGSRAGCLIRYRDEGGSAPTKTRKFPIVSIQWVEDGGRVEESEKRVESSSSPGHHCHTPISSTKLKFFSIGDMRGGSNQLASHVMKAMTVPHFSTW